MRIIHHPVVPVTVVHLFIYAACSLVETFEELLVGLWHRQGCNHDDLREVGAEHESLDAAVEVAYLLTVRAVGIHLPYLAAARLAAHEVNLTAIGTPHRIRLALGSVCYGMVVAAVDVHHEELAIRTVLLDAHIAHAIEEFCSVGRWGDFADLAEFLQYFRSEAMVGRHQFRPADDRSIVGCVVRTWCTRRCDDS